MTEIDALTGLITLFGLIVMIESAVLAITDTKPTEYGYGQKVKVRSGFYSNHIGYVVSRYDHKYVLELDVPLSENKITEHWYNLELVKEE